MEHLLKQLSEQFLQGTVGSDQFLKQLAPVFHQLQIADVGEAQLDMDRHRRCGFPEVVFSEGKSIDALRKIFTSFQQHGVDILATRMNVEQATMMTAEFPQGRYNPVARIFRLPSENSKNHLENLENIDKPSVPRGKVAIVSAGTSDLPIAEEARETADWTGAEVVLIQDVGVAGPHRLRVNLPLLEDADAIVVVAGMEGALPSVVGGYVSCPVIAVPTSIGYGASFGGVAALLGMLNSCASNVTVVNIDAGFKGGYVAGLIARNAAKNKKRPE